MRKLNSREIQLAELSILNKVAKFLDDNGIEYSLCGGTLIGAIRHKGFIPWDDDIDLMMTRPNYEKMQKIIAKKGINIGDNLFFHSFEQKNLNLPFTKIYDRSVIVDDHTYDNKYEQNLWIDIFPIDGFPNDEQESKKITEKNKNLQRILNTKKRMLNSTHGLLKIKKAFQKVLVFFIPYRFVILNILKNSKKYDFSSCNFAGISVWGYGMRERMDRDIFEGYIEIVFEGEKYKAIANYDKYLTNIYGHYMKLPPEEKRMTHNIDAWRVDEND